MNKGQWFSLGFGLLVLGVVLWVLKDPCYPLIDQEARYISCAIKRYGLMISATISAFLGVQFIMCGFLEKER